MSMIYQLDLTEQWKCLFTNSDTTGKMGFEEFFTDKEILDMDRLQNLGIFKNELQYFDGPFNHFEHAICSTKKKKKLDKTGIC